MIGLRLAMQNEAEKLARIASLRRRMWFWPLSLSPLLVLIAWRSHGSASKIAGVAVWWLVGLGVSLFGLSQARCPRCDARFFAKRFVPMGNACASCGFELKPRRVVYPTLE
jgi:ribosomal protein L37E